MLSAEFEKISDYYRSMARKYFCDGDIYNSLECVKKASDIAYSMNFKMYDGELESIIKSCSRAILPDIEIKGINNNVILLDYFGWDNKGLTQQYLRGLIDLNFNVTYILLNYDEEKSSNIRKELSDSGNVSVIKINNLDFFQKIQELQSSIIDVKPEYIFVHGYPSDTIALTVINSLSNVIKVNINITDHAFWLGYTFFDYNVNFRSTGQAISLNFRGSQSVKNVIIPFYPITNSDEFKGFDFEITQNDIIILSGGSSYKIADNESTFARLIESLLSLDARIKFIFVGGGNSKSLSEYFKGKSIESRVHVLGDRKDITHIIERCDIYLSTYPITGGLMNQLAAFYYKPLLILEKKDEVVLSSREFLFLENSNYIFSDTNSLLNYAKQLIASSDYRLEQGVYHKSKLISRIEFTQELDKFFKKSTPYNRIGANVSSKDLQFLKNSYESVERKSFRTLRFVLSQMGLKTFRVAPLLVFHLVRYIYVKRVLKSI